MMPDTDKIAKAWDRCNKCNMSLNADEECRKAYLDCEYTVGRYCGKDRLIYETIEAIEFFIGEQKRVCRADSANCLAIRYIEKFIEGMKKELKGE